MTPIHMLRRYRNVWSKETVFRSTPRQAVGIHPDLSAPAPARFRLPPTPPGPSLSLSCSNTTLLFICISLRIYLLVTSEAAQYERASV